MVSLIIPTYRERENLEPLLERLALVRGLAVHPRGFKILLELLVRGSVRHAREIPYVFTDRRHGSSKLDARALRAYLAQLGRLYWYRAVRLAGAGDGHG